MSRKIIVSTYLLLFFGCCGCNRIDNKDNWMISSQAVKHVQRLEKEHPELSAAQFKKSTVLPDSKEEIRMSNFNDSDFLFPSNWDFLSFSSLIRTLFFSQHAMQVHSEILPYQLLFS